VSGGVVWGSGPQTDKHLPQSPFTGRFLLMTHFALSSMSLIFLRLAVSKNKYQRGIQGRAYAKGLCFLSAVIANVWPDYRPPLSLLVSEAFIVERAMGLKLVSEVIEFICGGGG
jgi:hypothetical protein